MFVTETKEFGIDMIRVTVKPGYSDHGAGSNQNLSIWLPEITESGYLPVGHVAKQGYEKPEKGTFAIKGIKPNSVAYPLEFKQVWNDGGSGGNQDGAIWEPIAPLGYVALGMVSTQSYDPPALNSVYCVKEELTELGKIGKAIWGDWGSGAKKSCVLYSIIPPYKDYLGYNFFHAIPSYDKPTIDERVYVLKRD